MSRVPSRPAFTLVEILISILILALGMLGLGVLFPVIIREQRIGSDSTAGIAVSNNARAMLTNAQWGLALPNINNGPRSHPAKSLVEGPTSWLWEIFRDSQRFSKMPTWPIQDGLGAGFNGVQNGMRREFQRFGQGEWYTALINNDATNTAAPIGTIALGLPDGYIGITQNRIPQPFIEIPVTPATTPPSTVNVKVVSHINLPVSQRLYPVGANVQPQFVWDFAVQRKPDMVITNPPDADDLRAVVFVRHIDTRIHLDQSTPTLLDALPAIGSAVPAAAQRVPTAEDMNGNPTNDGLGGDTSNPGPRYSTIKTCEVEFFYQPATPALNHPDRLYLPNTRVDNRITLPTLQLLWSQMKQPGQKLVDNLGNVYTVVGSGNEPAVSAQSFDNVNGGDYIRVDPPVPVGEQQASPAAPAAGNPGTWPGTDSFNRRAIWQVCFTPQIPVSVSVFDLFKGNGQ